VRSIETHLALVVTWVLFVVAEDFNGRETLYLVLGGEALRHSGIDSRNVNYALHYTSCLFPFWNQILAERREGGGEE
jgi:hypothetical protein